MSFSASFAASAGFQLGSAAMQTATTITVERILIIFT
jgi:hypothetical protein